MKGQHAHSGKIGRPLSFDRDKALEKAMLAFWESGYETTSISDLTAAMGVTAPSIYTAFGDKRQLFMEAVELYAGDLKDIEKALDDAATARDAVAAMLSNAAVQFTGEATPKGCLLASAAATGSKGAADVRDAVAQKRRQIHGIIVRRIQTDVSRGCLPPKTDAGALAHLAVTITQGMSVLARDGFEREVLLELATTSMRCWPTSDGQSQSKR